MTSADRNDLVPARSAHAQGKLEWATPTVSLMDAGGTRGTKNPSVSEGTGIGSKYKTYFGS